jgi:hypothetical protein
MHIHERLHLYRDSQLKGVVTELLLLVKYAFNKI